MKHHLALVKTIHPCLKPAQGESVSDMDIILSQALLMDSGSVSFKAIKAGEIADILAGLVALAYAALQALAVQGNDFVENQVESRQEYQMLAIMRLLSEKIYRCSSAKAEYYSELYCLCSHLSSGFLNADFDKAFNLYHEWRKNCQESSDKPNKNTKPIDLSNCLYE